MSLRALEGWCCIKLQSQRGQAVIELALVIPAVIIILAGTIQLARIFYTYHTLQKALSGGASLLAKSNNVNYCDAGDPAILGAQNFIVYGNLQGVGTEILSGLADFPVQILPERQDAGTTTLNQCMCTQSDVDSCDVSTGGRAPDFIVVNLGNGFPLQLPFAFVSLTTINLRVSVRMPVTGG